MLKYLKGMLKDNKILKQLTYEIDNENEYFKYIRLRSHFTPKKPSKKYLDIITEECKGYKSMKKMFPYWASNRQECDSIIMLIEKIKFQKPYYMKDYDDKPRKRKDSSAGHIQARRKNPLGTARRKNIAV